MRFTWSLLVLYAAMVSGGMAYGRQSGAVAEVTSHSETTLKQFLLAYIRRKSTDQNTNVRYFDAWIDLNDDGKKEVLVYLIGPDWCGSAGCPLLILAPLGRSDYRIVTDVSVVSTPIRVLSAVSKGWLCAPERN